MNPLPFLQGSLSARESVGGIEMLFAGVFFGLFVGVITGADHGTAFDLAGTGQAEPDSLLAAVRSATALAAQA